MKSFNLGSLRSIELYTETEIITKSKEYTNYTQAFGKLKKLDEQYKMRVVGLLNGSEPFYQLQGDMEFFYYSSVKDELIKVAPSVEALKEIAEWLQALWEKTPTAMFLEKNAENLRKMKEFNEWLMEKKEANQSFWMNYAFKEFNIRYEV